MYNQKELVKRIISFILVLITSVGLLSETAFAARRRCKKYDTPDKAWEALSPIIDEATLGSVELQDLLKSIIYHGLSNYNKDKTENTKVGGSGANNNSEGKYVSKYGAGWSCWAYGWAFMEQLVEKNYSGKKYEMRGNTSFTYDDFVAAGIPQLAATVVRTAGSYYLYRSQDAGTTDPNVGHTMVILYYDKDYVYYISGNDNGKGAIYLTKGKWEDWTYDELTYKNRKIKYTATISDATFEKYFHPTYTNPANINANMSTNPPQATISTMPPDKVCYTVWATQDLNIRDKPSSQGKKLGHEEAGMKFEAYDIVASQEGGKDWYKISYNGKTAYISTSLASTQRPAKKDENKETKISEQGYENPFIISDEEYTQEITTPQKTVTTKTGTSPSN